MGIIGVGRTDVGRKREFNEDAFMVDLSTGLFALADGMGGHAAGEVAAKIAIETISEFIAHPAVNGPTGGALTSEQRASLPAERLRSAVRLANEKIFSAIEDHEELRGMGTTLVAALARDDRACFAHVGDSRAYLCRGGAMRQVTEDHSWVNEQVGLGLLSRQEASKHPFRNVITRALGSREDIQPDIAEITIEPKDTFLLCSDGLTTMLEDEEILGILMRHPGDPGGAAEELVARANQAGGEDNITVIVAGPARG